MRQSSPSLLRVRSDRSSASKLICARLLCSISGTILCVVCVAIGYKMHGLACAGNTQPQEAVQPPEAHL